ncbi:hypothetical protein [Streptomyces sp. NPDC020996]
MTAVKKSPPSRGMAPVSGLVTQQGPPARLLADTGGRLHELVRRQMA